MYYTEYNAPIVYLEIGVMFSKIDIQLVAEPVEASNWISILFL